MIVIIFILISYSIIAFLSIHLQLAKYSFSLYPENIEFYLTSLGSYKALFTGTIATCAAYFGLLQIKASMIATNDKIKNDSFNEWKFILEMRISELGTKDLTMYSEINKMRKQLFSTLFNSNFNIENKNQLKGFFDSHFKNKIKLFEAQNERYRENTGEYSNNEHSFSFDSFQFIFLGMIDKGYEDIIKDLSKLYVKNLDKDRNYKQKQQFPLA